MTRTTLELAGITVAALIGFTLGICEASYRVSLERWTWPGLPR